MITADQTGVLTIWDVRTQEPVYALQAHTGAVTRMEWHEDKQMLITCAKDKTIKMWKFPAVWVDENKVIPSMTPKYSKTTAKTIE